MRICTISRFGSKMANCGHGICKPIYTGAIYEATLSKDRKYYYWKRISSFGRTNTCLSEKYINEIISQSQYPYIENIRQYQRVL